MKTMRQLMLMDTPYEEVLHSEYPKTEEDLIMFLDGLDYVVEEWLDSLSLETSNSMEHESSNETASNVLMTVMWCRYAINQFWAEDEENRTVGYIEVMKAIRELKQSFMKLAKRYSREPYLANWYLDLPLRVQASFKNIHMKKISQRKPMDWRTNK